jgi:hypothetical protein
MFKMLTLIVALVVTGLVALSAATFAQEPAYTIKTKDFAAPGKSVEMTNRTTTRMSMTLALGGQALKEEKKVEVEDMEITEKVLEGGDKSPKKYTQFYTKALKGIDGAPTKQSYAGKTIVYELKGGSYQVTAESGDVDAADLEQFAKKANKPKVGQKLYPKKAVQVGETWTITPEILLEEIGGPTVDDVDIAKLRGQGKLLKAYKKEDQQWGTIEITGLLPIKKFGALVLDKTIDMKFSATADLPIDGSSTAGQVKGTISMQGKTTITQNKQTFTLDIAISGDVHVEHTSEK